MNLRPLAALFACATLLPAALAASTPEPAKEKRPKLVADEPLFEAGEIARDQVYEHTFKIRNSGDAVLTIHEVVVPPNTEILSRPASLAPGEAGEVRVRVPLLNERPLAQQKQIAIMSNDPDAPQFVLDLRILVTEYVAVKPGYARWISVQQEAEGKIPQQLAAADGKDFEILGISGTPPGVTADFTSTRKDPASPREWTVNLTLAKDAPVGAITGPALVRVNHPRQSIVPIPLSGFMRPVMAATPNVLKFGEFALTAKVTQPINIKSFASEAIRVTRVEHDLAGVAPATITARTEGREYIVKLEFDPATAPKGPLKGTLKVYTDSKKVPVVLVPVEGTIN